jgi:hypothetical protein
VLYELTVSAFSLLSSMHVYDGPCALHFATVPSPSLCDWSGDVPPLTVRTVVSKVGV